MTISSLKPKAKYSMKLEVVLADNHRFKFLNSRWLAVGSAEPQPLSESYLHPDSPNSGAFWMRHGVSFRKLKITNNKERPGNNVIANYFFSDYPDLILGFALFNAQVLSTFNSGGRTKGITRRRESITKSSFVFRFS